MKHALGQGGTSCGGARAVGVEATLVVLGVSCITGVMTYPLIREMRDALPNDLGDPLLVSWILGWVAERLRDGLAGVWDAPNFYPYTGTLTYSEHFLGIAILTAPVQWLSGNPILTYNVAFFVSYVVAGCGMYALTLSLTRSRPAAVVAALAFAFVPYRVAAVPHLHVLTCGWMPVGLLALHRYLDTGSRPALLGFVVAFLLQALSNLYFMYFFMLPVGVVVMAALVRRARPVGRLGAELALAGVLIGMVLAPVGWRYYQTHAELGFQRPRSGVVQLSADVVSYGQVSPRLAVWGDVLTQGRAEGQLFPGLTLLLLAGCGLAVGLWPRSTLGDRVSPPLRRVARLYALIGLLAFVGSLGPEPSVAGRVLTSSGPYDWLRMIVPGLDGIRVPARLAVVVYLALSVLAGVAVTVMLRHRSRRLAVPLCVGLAGAVLVEGYGGRLPMVPFSPGEDADRHEAYQWLMTSGPGAVLELPLGSRVSSLIYNNTRYQYATLQHGHPLVNGYSGYSSPLFQYLSGPRSPLSDLDHYGSLVEGLRALGVRYIVVHQNGYDSRPRARAELRAIRRQDDQLVAERRFGDTTVFWLAGWEPAVEPDWRVLRRLPLARAEVTTSHQGERWALAVDGDGDTRWLTGGRQTGRERIEVRLDETHDVGLVRLVLRQRSLGDYPRELVIESVDSHGVVHELYRGGVLRQLFQGLVREWRWIDVDVALPPNRTHTLRLRQIGRTRTWYWSIHEFSVWVRNALED